MSKISKIGLARTIYTLGVNDTTLALAMANLLDEEGFEVELVEALESTFPECGSIEDAPEDCPEYHYTSSNKSDRRRRNLERGWVRNKKLTKCKKGWR